MRMAKGPSNLHSPLLSSSESAIDAIADGAAEASGDNDVCADEAATVAISNRKVVVVVMMLVGKGDAETITS